MANMLTISERQSKPPKIISPASFRFSKTCDFSGLNNNYDKTQVLRIGSLKDSDAQLITQKPLSWVKEITVLGVKFTATTQEMPELNYEVVLNKLEGAIVNWTNRSLTILGKILVLNTLLASQFVYKFLCLHSPSQVLSAYRKLATEFLWNSK